LFKSETVGEQPFIAKSLVGKGFLVNPAFLAFVITGAKSA